MEQKNQQGLYKFKRVRRRKNLHLFRLDFKRDRPQGLTPRVYVVNQNPDIFTLKKRFFFWGGGGLEWIFIGLVENKMDYIRKASINYPVGVFVRQDPLAGFHARQDPLAGFSDPGNR